MHMHTHPRSLIGESSGCEVAGEDGLIVTRGLRCDLFLQDEKPCLLLLACKKTAIMNDIVTRVVME